MSRYGAKCNVTACDELHDDIPHQDTGHKYCWFCARKINEANYPEVFFLKEDIQKGLDVRRQRDLKETQNG